MYEKRKKTIGKRIQSERKRLKITQAELLKRCYLSENSVSSLRAWEQGDRLPDLDTLCRMADVFECDVGYLLGDYDARSRVTSDICNETGLSEKTVEIFRYLRQISQNPSVSGTRIAKEALELFNCAVDHGFMGLLQDIVLFMQDDLKRMQTDDNESDIVKINRILGNMGKNRPAGLAVLSWKDFYDFRLLQCERAFGTLVKTVIPFPDKTGAQKSKRGCHYGTDNKAE